MTDLQATWQEFNNELEKLLIALQELNDQNSKLINQGHDLLLRVREHLPEEAQELVSSMLHDHPELDSCSGEPAKVSCEG